MFYFGDSLTSIVMGEDTDPLIFLLGIIYGSAHGLLAFVQNQFRWDLKSKNYAIVGIATSIFSTLLALVFAIVLEYGLLGILLGLIVGNLIGILIGLFVQREKFLEASLINFLKCYWFFCAFGSIGIGCFFSAYLDRFMINKIIGIEAVGVYGVGFRIASLVGILTIGLRGAFMPTIYKCQTKTLLKSATAFRLFAVGALSFLQSLFYFQNSSYQFYQLKIIFLQYCSTKFSIGNNFCTDVYLHSRNGIGQEDWLNPNHQPCSSYFKFHSQFLAYSQIWNTRSFFCNIMQWSNPFYLEYDK